MPRSLINAAEPRLWTYGQAGRVGAHRQL